MIKLLGEMSFPERLNEAHHPKGNLHEPAYLQAFGGFRERLIETFVTA